MKFQTVVYWDQYRGGKGLSDYCTSISGIDIIILAFLSQLLPDNKTLAGSFGQSCSINISGTIQGCDNLASDIRTCQAANVKIILSLGGAKSTVNPLSLGSQSQAEDIGQLLWDMYGNEQDSTASRPFGKTFVDGFDFDIEQSDGNQYYQYIISSLRSNFAKDPLNKYYITGAPQCFLPEPNMGTIIQQSQFDYLWIQFYNNPCALGLDNGEKFNWKNWIEFLSPTPSRNATLFIGLPASEYASTGDDSGSQYYVAPEQVATPINSKKNTQNFGGVMLWDAGYSDGNIYNGCTYAQNIHHILAIGSVCGYSESLSSPPPISRATAPAQEVYTPPPPPKTTAPSTSMQVPMWGQCGGQDYTGPTICLPPYQCIQLSKWWSSCH
ncbi:hypothetical protein N5P37_005655 [Trichoderma harzianum]|nr:hypothetical protein N5P37_005655 [Trichoderma harzianum]